MFDLKSVVADLAHERQQWRAAQSRSNEPGGREFPSRDSLANVVESLKGILFPMRLGPADLRQESEDFYVGYTLDAALHALLAQVKLELSLGGHAQDTAHALHQ
ncbi:MAG: serine acetyltransferase, partial [Burkholderiales bacterium]|nr:serine acetyltransferase [Burkholderiales bacterium]